MRRKEMEKDRTNSDWKGKHKVGEIEYETDTKQRREEVKEHRERRSRLERAELNERETMTKKEKQTRLQLPDQHEREVKQRPELSPE